MAVYRQVQITFWQDAFVLELTPEEKYFYLYLMTNSKTSQCGIYELPKRIMEIETGYNRETIDKLLKRFIDYKKILYCEDTKEIMLLNWIKYNGSNSPKIKSRVEKELMEVKNKEFVKIYIQLSNEYQYSINTVSIQYQYSMDTESQKEKEEEKEEEEEKEKEEEQQQENGSSSLTSEDELSATEEEGIDEFKELATLYQQCIGMANALTAEWLQSNLEQYGFEWCKNALLEADRKGKRTKSYVDGILQNWQRDGGMKLGGEHSGAGSSNPKHIREEVSGTEIKGPDLSHIGFKGTGEIDDSDLI